MEPKKAVDAMARCPVNMFWHCRFGPTRNIVLPPPRRQDARGADRALDALLACGAREGRGQGGRAGAGWT